MEELKRRIVQEAGIISKQVLNLDTVLNHQVDPPLIMEMGRRFAALFREQSITKVLTIESSGITVGFATALDLGVPLVFARRKKTLTTDQEVYSERVPSFTKGIVTDILVSKSVLGPNDRVLLIDDIIANGDAARGLIRVIERSGAELVGLGIVVEKCFQAGARTIRESGFRLESLVKIQSLDNGEVKFL
ncbi:xanthine phosphoribosyltransferase [Paenibacillus koleovorans]|uniref:xanthine phosphoribosyltransferase n=1 Tax=Paenibacillus koleovorans TaxID=121608 RepID=UPI000FDBCAFA|nr:xanthine phosphoribosyltransferase [Paenibacillus koleovorans]